jgi:SAM-dependent methyltransferase
MTGNVAQVFLTEEDWTRALKSIYAALRPGGHLVFETRRPDRRIWEDWAADAAPVVLDIPGGGSVERRMEVTSVSLPLVSYRWTYRFLPADTIITSDSTRRFRGRVNGQVEVAAGGQVKVPAPRG